MTTAGSTPRSRLLLRSWPSSSASARSQFVAGRSRPTSTAGARQGVTSEELAEIKALKAENRRLREDVDILKRATTFFAGELDPRNR